ncbi:BLUF domain-containing protein [Loktanella sp. DJP18]|uniref:BLUF domain-containing protein n=1 Tax=Loktanella sp. DJP18 TaxID=3409788 RepID=UPI003BB641EF
MTSATENISRGSRTEAQVLTVMVTVTVVDGGVTGCGECVPTFEAGLPKRALIGDMRNDENIIVAQFHLSVLRFHNKVVEFLAANDTSWVADFHSAKTLSTPYYQWLAVEGFLKTMCDPDVPRCDVALVPLSAMLASRCGDDPDRLRSIRRSKPARGVKIIAHLTQLIYASQPFGFDDAILNGILLDARRCNQRDGITGALVCRHDIYLQLLEGPSEQVDAAYARIARDDRHVGINRLVSREITERMFQHWAMLHDPAKSLIWSPDQLSSGILESAPESEIVGMFESVARDAKPEDASLQL